MGLPKSASTYIQKVALPSIPDFGYLKDPVLDGLMWRLMESGPKFDAQEERDHLHSYLSQTDRMQADSWIFSHEVLTGGMHSSSNAHCALANANAVFDPEKVVIVVRDQVDFLTSAYKHYVKSGGTLPLNAFLTKRSSPAVSKTTSILDKLDYWSLIKCMHRIYGQDRVKILYFERVRTDELYFLNEILEVLNVDDRDKERAHSKHEQIKSSFKTNRGIPFGSIPVIRLLNQFVDSAYHSSLIPIWRTKPHRPIRVLSKIFSGPDKRQTVINAVPEEHLETIRSGNREIEKQQAVDLRSLGYLC